MVLAKIFDNDFANICGNDFGWRIDDNSDDTVVVIYLVSMLVMI
jgi:hypothetical protein